ncbi:PREDICTED: basigin [Elephantulus edwardii]|uniref:basigin n=1 Tax=Elephantulus edwardii TaxID=28737 RepID=UPI0003F0E70D|nr:PREDICTED: basigin [Elephantulus edwardii]
MAAVLLVVLAAALLGVDGASGAAGFVLPPLSQERGPGDHVELHCEAVGSPVPEIQWWFEGVAPDAPCAQLWDGARQDRIHIHAAYHQHAASTLSIAGLTMDDAGTYECRASNDPDRNHLTRAPRVRWVRAQASVLVREPGEVSIFVEKMDSKTLLTCTLNHSTTPIEGHRWMQGDKVLMEDQLSSLSTQFEVDSEDSGKYDCIFLPEDVGRASISVEGLPKVFAVKKSEHANEGETVTLKCKSNSFPPITSWVWFKKTDAEEQLITNSSQNKFLVTSADMRTELHISSLDLEKDPGVYVCNGTSSSGTDQASITLRVRSRLAALWPFLGIVAEVLVLVTIIFIYEKRRKPEEVLDDEDMGSTPLKSGSHHVNDKEKNVRQRNAN